MIKARRRTYDIQVRPSFSSPFRLRCVISLANSWALSVTCVNLVFGASISEYIKLVLQPGETYSRFKGRR